MIVKAEHAVIKIFREKQEDAKEIDFEIPVSKRAYVNTMEGIL